MAQTSEHGSNVFFLYNIITIPMRPSLESSLLRGCLYTERQPGSGRVGGHKAGTPRGYTGLDKKLNVNIINYTTNTKLYRKWESGRHRRGHPQDIQDCTIN